MTLEIDCLVIGYGNTLRNDDGAGQHIADTVATWALPSVRSIAVHQLLPELAEPLSIARMAIFVDVYGVNDCGVDDCGGNGNGAVLPSVPEPCSTNSNIMVQVIELIPTAPTDRSSELGHRVDPRSLLALTQQVYGITPSSWWILVPAVNFEFGEQFSSVTQQGIQQALNQIRQLIDSITPAIAPP